MASRSGCGRHFCSSGRRIGAGADRDLKFSHVVAPNTPKGKGAEKFKELGEKYTNGKVKIEVYANSSLYKDKEELEALQLGAVQMLAPSNSKFGPIGIKDYEVFDLPYSAAQQGRAAESHRRSDWHQDAQAARNRRAWSASPIGTTASS